MGIPQIPKLPSLSLPNPADSAAGVMCRKMEESLDTKLGELAKVKNMINGPLDSLTGKLSDMVGRVATPLDEMESTLGDLKSAASDAIPKTLGVDEVKDLLEKCGILKGELPSLSDTAILDNYTKDIGSSFKNMLGSFFGGLDLDLDFPEIGVGNMLGGLKSLLDKVNISGLLGGLDGYLNCLDSLCGANVSDKLDYANNIVDDMKLTAEGALDVEGILNSSGIDTDQIKNIMDAKKTNEENEEDLSAATENAGVSLVVALHEIKNSALGSIAPINPFA